MAYWMLVLSPSNDSAVKAAMANASYGALLIQTDVNHDELPNWFLPWMAGAI
jgi:hypothetical protein